MVEDVNTVVADVYVVDVDVVVSESSDVGDRVELSDDRVLCNISVIGLNVETFKLGDSTPAITDTGDSTPGNADTVDSTPEPFIKVFIALSTSVLVVLFTKLSVEDIIVLFTNGLAAPL